MNRLSLRQVIASEKGLVLADQVVVSGSAFATNILLAQALGLAAYGQFSAVVLGQVFLLSIQQAAGTGLYQIIWPRLAGSVQKAYTTGLFYATMSWLLLLMLVAGLCSWLIPASIFATSSAWSLAAILAMGLFLAQDFLRKTLLVQGQTTRAFWLDASTNGSQLLLLVLCRETGTLSLPTALWIIGGTFVPSILAGLVWLKPGRFRLADCRLVWTLHRQQGGWMLLSALTQWLAGNFFVVAGGWWLGAAALGALRLAQYIFGLLNVLLQALENYVVPRAAKLASSPDALLTYLTSVLLKSLAGLLPALILLIVIAEPLLGYTGGASYRVFGYVMYGLAVVYILVIGGYPIRIILRVRSLTKHYFIGYAVATVFSLTTATWLIKSYALMGVLAGLFFTQVILISYWLLVLQHHQLLLWKSFISFWARPIRPE